MYRKLYWGLGVFLVLFIGFFVFVMVKNQSENRELMDQLAEMEKLTVQIKEREAVKNEPPVAKEGYKMVPHGDHWHEVPIDAPDVWPSEQVDVSVPILVPKAPIEYTGPLTFHAELLKSHPVEAVRQQAIERGHWSADHIPPFQPDDLVAAEIARKLYLYRYYRWTGQTDSPDFDGHRIARTEIIDSLTDWYRSESNKTPWDIARNHDLWKLVWPDTTRDFAGYVRQPTTFTEGINPLTARPLLPIELKLSNRGSE